MGRMRSLVPRKRIEQKILVLRGEKVMLDADLAELYGVSTFNLNKAVKRNISRFPKDFMFQLTAGEAISLRFQIGMSKPKGRGGRRYLPYVFTEQGVAMLSSVLRSKRAIQVNIAIMRAFVKLREMAGAHRDLTAKLNELERRVASHDTKIGSLFESIRQLMAPATASRRIGFRTKEEDRIDLRDARRALAEAKGKGTKPLQALVKELETSTEFWRLMEKRRKEPTITLREMRKRLSTRKRS